MTFTPHSASRSHKGHVRALNEDAFYTDSDQGIWCVADGMGGHDAGEVASALVVESVAGVTARGELQSTVNAIQEAVSHVNYRLTEERTLGLQNQVMGSTVVAVVIMDEECACLWAGDSRLYLYRADCLYQMTRDHSVVEELIQQGVIQPEEAESHPQRHVITRAVGADSALELEMISFALQAGDVLLLCSDGLYGELTPEQIMTILGAGQDSETMAGRLIERVLAGQARDNVTVSVISLQAS